MATGALLIIGSEMLDPLRRDANGPRARQRLAELGVSLSLVARVEDREASIAEALRAALACADVVIASGGLGPTGDDLTREAVARLFGAGIREDLAWADHLRERLAGWGRKLDELGWRQALVVEGAELLPNRAGLACGNWLEREGKVVALLPGVPREFEDILENEVLPRLAARFPRRPEVRVVRATVAGLPEVRAERTLRPWYSRPGVAVSILPALGILEIAFTLRAPPAEGLQELEAEVRGALAEGLGPHLVSLDGAPLPQVLGRALLARGETLALAESCTGGLAAQKVVSVPGASRYFLGSVTAYANAAKVQLLSVPEATLEACGAVSGETALAMARGARARFQATWGAATTGVAGPEGGTPKKPVGMVWVGIAGPGIERTLELHFPLDRASVMELAANALLFRLWRAVEERG